MSQKKNKTYPEEFKKEAVRMLDFGQITLYLRKNKMLKTKKVLDTKDLIASIFVN